MAGVYEERSEQPGGREPAPDELGTLQSFVNTHNIEADLELFDRPAVASRWLLDHGLTTERGVVENDADLQRVVALREALRSLLASPSTRSGEVIDSGAATGALSVVVNDEGGIRIVATADGLDGALARIVLFVVSASGTGQWRRLKVCTNVNCQWAFWDSSRNRSGRWCTMSLCGNQAKVRAHRQRANQ